MMMIVMMMIVMMMMMIVMRRMTTRPNDIDNGDAKGTNKSKTKKKM